MKKTRRRYRRESHVFQAVRLPAMMTEMMFSSFETIARRSWMLAQGKCSPTECARMVLEKQQARSVNEKTGKVGIAQFVLRNQDSLCMLKPYGQGSV
jgi:hypothetical protein